MVRNLTKLSFHPMIKHSSAFHSCAFGIPGIWQGKGACNDMNQSECSIWQGKGACNEMDQSERSIWQEKGACKEMDQSTYWLNLKTFAGFQNSKQWHLKICPLPKHVAFRKQNFFFKKFLYFQKNYLGEF